MSNLRVSNTPPLEMNPHVRYLLTSDNFTDVQPTTWVRNKYVRYNNGQVEIIDSNDFSYAIVEAPLRGIDYLYQGSIYGDASIICIEGATGRVRASYKAPAGRTSKESAIHEMEFFVPPTTSRILISYANPYINTPGPDVLEGSFRLPFKLYTGDWCWDVSFEVPNWGEIQISSQRKELTGVIADVTIPIEIFQTKRLAADKSGFDIVEGLFNEYGVHAKAKLIIYLRDDIDVNVYTLEKEMRLDFERYQWQDEKIDITTTTSDLYDVVKSKGATNYDIPVSSLKDSKPFVYSPLELQCSAKYTMPTSEDIVINDGEAQASYTLNVINTDTELIPGRSLLEIRSQNFSSDWRSEYMALAERNVTVHIRMKFKIVVNGLIPSESNQIRLDILHPNGGETYIQGEGLHNNELIEFEYNGTANMVIDDKLYIYIFISKESNREVTVSIRDFEYFEIYWAQSAGSSFNIDCIRPEKLLNGLLSRMDSRFTGVIEWEKRDYTPVFIAGESIRGIPRANVHTSLNNFTKWMKTLGYEYDIRDKTFVYTKRDNLFKKNTITLALRDDEINNLKIHVNREFLYTAVKIGYAKKEYNDTNGRFEVNGTFDYSTGYITSTESRQPLDLISPYRADHFGIEYTSWKRYEQSTDASSDNDLFIIAAEERASFFWFYNGIFSRANYDIVGSALIYNVALNPYYLLQENESMIGIVTQNASFAGTSNNRHATVLQNQREVDIYSDIQINKKLIDPTEYTLDVGSYRQLPYERNGLVTFNFLGKSYKGYIVETLKNPGKEKADKWHFYALNE